MAESYGLLRPRNTSGVLPVEQQIRRSQQRQNRQGMTHYDTPEEGETIQSVLSMLNDMGENAIKEALPSYSGVMNEDPEIADQAIEQATRKVTPLAGEIAGGGFGSSMMFAPKGDAVLGMFAGRNALTADKRALGKAMQMEGRGASRDDILQETRWLKDSDDNWLFEIDDSKAVTKAINKKGEHPLTDAIDHPEIFEAYPSLLDTVMQLRTKNGMDSAFYPDKNKIKMGMFDAPDAKAVSVDELNKELGAMKETMRELQDSQPGGMFKLDFEDPEYQKFNAMKDAFKKKVADFKKPPKGKEAVPQKPITLHEIQHAIQQQEGHSRGGSPTSERGEDGYYKLLGEANARNTEYRSGFTPEQRLSRPPWETRANDMSYPFTDDQLIIKTPWGKK